MNKKNQQTKKQGQGVMEYIFICLDDILLPSILLVMHLEE